MEKQLSSFELASQIAGGSFVNKYNPTETAVHIDGPLTNMSVAMIQSASNFVRTLAQFCYACHWSNCQKGIFCQPIS